MTQVSDTLFHRGGQPVGNPALGNVYYVIKTNEAYYSQFLKDRQGTYPDGSAIVYGAAPASCQTAIQAALDACVEGRGDRVYLQASDSDYDITAVITLSKKGVHLLCDDGLGLERGATNACRIHQNTAATAIFAVSDSAIEIAGFYLKNYTDCAHITIAASSYGLNIHHNMLVLSWTAAPVACVQCAGDGGAWGQVIHHCLITSQGGDDQTCAALITIGASATGARCDYNDIFMGDGNVCTIGISNAATKGTANYNNFMVAGSDGGFTHCINHGIYGVAIGNRGCVGDGAIVVGGVNDITDVDNMNAVNGGAIDDLG
jgi:hypothetical protein